MVQMYNAFNVVLNNGTNLLDTQSKCLINLTNKCIFSDRHVAMEIFVQFRHSYEPRSIYLHSANKHHTTTHRTHKHHFVETLIRYFELTHLPPNHPSTAPLYIPFVQTYKYAKCFDIKTRICAPCAAA